jgi:hypothetical protein
MTLAVSDLVTWMLEYSAATRASREAFRSGR